MIKTAVLLLVFSSTNFIIINNSIAQHLIAHTNEFVIKPGSANSTSKLPILSWITPSMDVTATAESKITVQFRISTVEEITAINFSVIDSKTNSVISKKSNFSITEKQQQIFTFPVNLPSGHFVLLVEMNTKSGIVINERRQIVAGKNNNELISLERKDYALIFATDKYDHWSDLVNPIEDARSIADELSKNYGFHVEIVENPTVDEVWNKIRSYSEMKFLPQDQLLIFFAGHGHFDDTFGEGYIVAKNSLLNDMARSTYISHNRLRGLVNNLACNHVLLMLDVCFGGTLDPVIAKHRGNTDEVSTTQMLVRKWNYRTRKYITSGGKEYVSDGIPGKHSPFTSKFIEMLKGNGNGDMIITLPELSTSFERLQQLPRFGSFGDDDKLSDFVFMRKIK